MSATRDLPFAILAVALLVGGVLAFGNQVTRSPGQAAEVASGAPEVAVLPFIDTDSTAPAFRYPGAINGATVIEGKRYLSSDPFPRIAHWYWDRLPASAMAEMEPGKHVIVGNEAIQIELKLEAGGQTSIHVKRKPPTP